ncbi:Bardet-Biedl syndrome 10 protein-like [Arapaima gigas]
MRIMHPDSTKTMRTFCMFYGTRNGTGNAQLLGYGRKHFRFCRRLPPGITGFGGCEAPSPHTRAAGDMSETRQVGLGTLLQVAEALEVIVCRCVGPRGGQVMFTKDTGEVLITRHGSRMLTALLLDHPIARASLDCLSAHCNTTGDGAKSFVLLLAALLRGVGVTCQRQEAEAGPRRQLAARRMSRCLLSFQEEVLDCLMRDRVAPHATSLLSHDNPAQSRARVGQLMEGFFHGRVTGAQCKYLAQIASDFFFRWSCQLDKCELLRLICDHFLAFHTAVTGLPVGRSHILEGLVLHKDFAVYCPKDGPLNALVVSVPLQPSLEGTDETLIVTSNLQLHSFGGWIGSYVEQIITSLNDLQVKLILSTVKQSDLVLYQARRKDMSVVECVGQAELSLFCLLAGVSPLSDLGTWKGVDGRHVAAMTFCRPVVLGSHRYVHVGFSEQRGFSPHCLVLCGPVPGLTDQCVSAFGDAFKMLRRTSEPVRWRRCHNAEATGEMQAVCSGDITDLQGEPDSQRNDNRPDVDVKHRVSESEKAPTGLPSQGHSCKTKTESMDLVSPQNCSSEGHAFGRNIEKGITAGDVTVAHSEILIKPGTVLPVGGAFELLLHHYLLRHSLESSCPQTKATCKWVAEALLNVPRRLYFGRHAHRQFLQVHARFVRGVRTREPVGPVIDGQEALESLACKYELLASVLQCVARLLSVDAVICTTTLGLTAKDEEDDP